MSSLLGSPEQGAERQACCRIVDPTTLSGAVCRGAAAAWLDNNVPWLGWGLGGQYLLDGISANHPRLASVLRLPGECAEARVRWEYACAAHSSCHSPIVGCPRRPKRCCSSAPARGHSTGLREPGVPLWGPRTAAAVTPTCSHISHTNCSLRQVLIQFVAVSITTSQRFLVLSVATRLLSFGM